MFKLRARKSTTVRTIEPALRTAFTDEEIARLASLGSLMHVTSGEDLMVEGTEGTHAFFITTGSAAIKRGDDIVAMVGRGDLVGERALVTDELRNATVTARMPVTALQLDREQFARLCSESPKVAALSQELVAARN